MTMAQATYPASRTPSAGPRDRRRLGPGPLVHGPRGLGGSSSPRRLPPPHGQVRLPRRDPVALEGLRDAKTPLERALPHPRGGPPVFDYQASRSSVIEQGSSRSSPPSSRRRSARARRSPRASTGLLPRRPRRGRSMDLNLRLLLPGAQRSGPPAVTVDLGAATDGARLIPAVAGAGLSPRCSRSCLPPRRGPRSWGGSSPTGSASRGVAVAAACSRDAACLHARMDRSHGGFYGSPPRDHGRCARLVADLMSLFVARPSRSPRTLAAFRRDATSTEAGLKYLSSARSPGGPWDRARLRRPGTVDFGPLSRARRLERPRRSSRWVALLFGASSKAPPSPSVWAPGVPEPPRDTFLSSLSVRGSSAPARVLRW